MNFRLEIERRKQEELERQLAIQRELEERRLEELQKNEEQKEQARREMERQRKAEMEENKRQELLGRRQKEADDILKLKGVNHGLGLELSQLVDKVKELSDKITDTRGGVSSVKADIDEMRTKRDSFIEEMGILRAKLKDQNRRMLQAAQEKIRTERNLNESEVKQMNLKQLREKLKNMKAEVSRIVKPNIYNIIDKLLRFLCNVFQCRFKTEIMTNTK
jgi:chromosome segregation ATPase